MNRCAGRQVSQGIAAFLLPARGRPARPALGLLVSIALHGLLIGLALPHLAWHAPPASSAQARTAFSLRLIARDAVADRVSAPGGRAPAAVPSAAIAAQPARRPKQASAAIAAAPLAEAPPLPETATTPAPLEDGMTRPGAADIMAAARREAGLLARAMNRAPGADADFRSRVQADLDRHFEAAHAAAGGWTRAAGIKDITRASDGATRIYRIETPLGAFCMTYTGGSGRPSYSTCPR